MDLSSSSNTLSPLRPERSEIYPVELENQIYDKILINEVHHDFHNYIYNKNIGLDQLLKNFAITKSIKYEDGSIKSHHGDKFFEKNFNLSYGENDKMKYLKSKLDGANLNIPGVFNSLVSLAEHNIFKNKKIMFDMNYSQKYVTNGFISNENNSKIVFCSASVFDPATKGSKGLTKEAETANVIETLNDDVLNKRYLPCSFDYDNENGPTYSINIKPKGNFTFASNYTTKTHLALDVKPKNTEFVNKGDFSINKVVTQLKKTKDSKEKEFLLRLKGLGDHFQVLFIREYNQGKTENEKITLFTGDTLCFLYALYNDVPCIYSNNIASSKRKNFITTGLMKLFQKKNPIYFNQVLFDVRKKDLDAMKNNVIEGFVKMVNTFSEMYKDIEIIDITPNTEIDGLISGEILKKFWVEITKDLQTDTINEKLQKILAFLKKAVETQEFIKSNINEMNEQGINVLQHFVVIVNSFLSTIALISNMFTDIQNKFESFSGRIRISRGSIVEGLLTRLMKSDLATQIKNNLISNNRRILSYINEIADKIDEVGDLLEIRLEGGDLGRPSIVRTPQHLDDIQIKLQNTKETLMIEPELTTYFLDISSKGMATFLYEMDTILLAINDTYDDFMLPRYRILYQKENISPHFLELYKTTLNQRSTRYQGIVGGNAGFDPRTMNSFFKNVSALMNASDMAVDIIDTFEYVYDLYSNEDYFTDKKEFYRKMGDVIISIVHSSKYSQDTTIQTQLEENIDTLDNVIHFILESIADDVGIIHEFSLENEDVIAFLKQHQNYTNLEITEDVIKVENSTNVVDSQKFKEYMMNHFEMRYEIGRVTRDSTRLIQYIESIVGKWTPEEYPDEKQNDGEQNAKRIQTENIPGGELSVQSTDASGVPILPIIMSIGFGLMAGLSNIFQV